MVGGTAPHEFRYRRAVSEAPLPTPLPPHLAPGGEAAAAFAESLRDAIAEACVGDFGRRSLARRLGISTTLSASAIRVLDAPDPISTLSALPGGRGRRSLVRKIADAGVTPPIVQRLQTSLERLDQLLEGPDVEHETLRSFVSNAGAGRSSRMPTPRSLRSAFDTACQLWGLRLHGLVTCSWITPAADGIHCDLAGGQLFLELERLRPGPTLPVCWPPLIARSDRYEIDPGIAGSLRRTRGPLFEELGSPDLGTDEVEVSTRGVVSFGTPAPSRGGSIDLGAAYSVEGLGTIRGRTESEFGELNANVSVPTDAFLLEVWLHRDLVRGGDPAGAFYNLAIRPGDGLEYRESRRLPLHESVERLEGPASLPPPLVPLQSRYEALSRHATTRLGATPDAFVGFRAMLRCPPLHTSLVLRWKLAPPAG